MSIVYHKIEYAATPLSEAERLAEDKKWDEATNGIIFEFTDINQARAFAAAVTTKFKMAARVFEDAEEAERVHLNPFRQFPPVVHVDRPMWFLPPGHSDADWKAASAAESRIMKLAEKFGGDFAGT
jgi:hypothetical protein